MRRKCHPSTEAGLVTHQPDLGIRVPSWRAITGSSSGGADHLADNNDPGQSKPDP